jgi:phosphatidylglycerophosphate synthase
MIVRGWQLPEAPLRTSAVATHTIGLLAVVGLAWTAHARLQLGDLYPLKAGAAFAIVVLLAAGFLRGHHPFTRLGPANQITTARAMLVALVIGLVGEPAAAASAAIASAGIAALDGVDGWLARRSRMASDFGARFDMEIDARLILALAMLAWRYGKAGVWVLSAGLIRYLFVAAGWRWPWLQAPLAPSGRRKLVCVVQTVALSVAILPTVTPPLSSEIAALSIVALCASFLIDIGWLWRHAPAAAV